MALKDDGSVLWTPRLALVVGGPGALLFAASILGAVHWHTYGDGDLGTTLMIVNVIGFCALLMAVVCWAESAVYQRGTEMVFPSAAGGLHRREVRRRIWLHRRNGGQFYVLVLVLALVPLGIFVGYRGDPYNYLEKSWGPAAFGMVLLSGSGVLWLIFSGLPARFLITPTELRIDSMLRSVRIPRRLIGTFEPSGTRIRLNMVGGGRIAFRVDSPINDLSRPYRHNRRTQVRTAERILAALARVPDTGASHDRVVAKWRPFLVVVSLLCAAGMIVGAVLTGLNWGLIPNGAGYG